MRLSADGLQAIVRRECPAPDFKPVLRAYDDKHPERILIAGDVVEGTLTWGCGHTGNDVYIGKTGTDDEAYTVLKKDCGWAEAAINTWVTSNITQAMFDSLVSFVMNVGTGAKNIADGFVWLRSGKHSSLLTAINESRFDDVPALMLEWVHQGKEVSKGLRNRRLSEITQGEWVKGAYVASSSVNVAPAPSWWQQWHNRLIATGITGAFSGIGGDALHQAGTQLQGLSQYGHVFATLGLAMIVLGIVWNLRKQN